MCYETATSCISASMSGAESRVLPCRARSPRLAAARSTCAAFAAIGLAWVVLIAGGCETVAPRPYPPRVRMDSLRVLAFSQQDMRVRFGLAVDNPNAFPLSVVSMDTTIAFDDAPFGMGKTTGPVKLAPGPGNHVDVDFHTTFPALVYAAEHLGNKPKLYYDLTGSVTLADGLRLSFSYHGDIAAPDFRHPEGQR